MPDFSVTDHGTIVMLAANTSAAKAWLRDNVEVEPWQWMGDAFAIEPRYAAQLVEGIQADDLTVE